MKFSLSKLPYEKNALEPVISERTINIHHGKHHQKYVDKLNQLIENTAFEHLSMEEIIKNSDGAIFNNAAQVWNHTFYFDSFTPEKNKNPSGDLLARINEDFGSLEEFKTDFETAATSLFGSGWIWLVKEKDGHLSIQQGPNAWNPIIENNQPLLTCDVWEHAYYLDYENKKAEYVKQFWSIIDWDKITDRYKKIG